jgi:ABC-2 type transport system permease protein
MTNTSVSGRFKAFVIKEFRHILRDRRTLLILFGMPLAQVLLFGFVLSNDIKDAAIAIVDPARDAQSISLTDKLASSGYFQVAERPENAALIENAFRKGQIRMAVVFPPDFGQSLAHEGKVSLQLIGDASDPNTATTLINYASAIINDWQAAYNQQAPAPYLIGAETRMLYNPEQKSVFNFVPGVMTLILMLVSAMMTSITLAREKETGTMEILLVSPLKPIQIILGKTAPYLVLSFINAILVVALGVLVFGMPMRGSVLFLAAACLLYMFVSLSLGIFISTRAADQMQAQFMSALGLLMPTMLLSGFIFPRESMPLPLQVIGSAFPATWFNPVIKGIMIKGVGLASLWKPLAILAGMALFFIVISLRNFKDRL